MHCGYNACAMIRFPGIATTINQPQDMPRTLWFIQRGPSMYTLGLPESSWRDRAAAYSARDRSAQCAEATPGLRSQVLREDSLA